MAENTAKKQRGRPFQPGQSGNPMGKPKGALNQTTRAAQELLDGKAQALTRKAVELAQDGNVVPLRLCLERLIPPRKDRPINLKLPQVDGVGDIPKALGALLEAVADGGITPQEGQAVAGMIEAYRKGVELADIDARLTALEEKTEREKH
jgi:Family of unknown function (DUF5681)